MYAIGGITSGEYDSDFTTSEIIAMLLKLNYIRLTVCYKSLLYHVTKLLKITYSIWCAINHTIKYTSTVKMTVNKYMLKWF